MFVLTGEIMTIPGMVVLIELLILTRNKIGLTTRPGFYDVDLAEDGSIVGLF